MGARRKKAQNRVSPLAALADLNIAFADTPEYIAARRAILIRFARLSTNGVPVLCTPPRRELLMDRVPGAFKVIYDTERNAIAAARELACLGSPPQKPYLCERGNHLHLKTLDQYCKEKKRSTG